MQYLPLFILLVLVSLLSVLIDRRRARKIAAAAQAPVHTVNRAAGAAVDPATATASQATAAQAGLFTRLTNQWSQRFGRQPALPDDPVRAWLAGIFVDNPAERVWFASLTPDQFKLLRNELAGFCAELGFDLAWLVEQASFKPAVLEQTGKTIVTHYCRAVRAAVLVHDDLRALQRYQAFLDNPTSKENLAFGQQLFALLVDEGLATAATPELLMAGEKERQSFVVEAIQAAAAKDNVAFSTALKVVALGVAQTVPSAPATKAPATVAPAMQNGASVASPVAA
jgi:hypothetical protein